MLRHWAWGLIENLQLDFWDVGVHHQSESFLQESYPSPCRAPVSSGTLIGLDYGGDFGHHFLSSIHHWCICSGSWDCSHWLGPYLCKFLYLFMTWLLYLSLTVDSLNNSWPLKRIFVNPLIYSHWCVQIAILFQPLVQYIGVWDSVREIARMYDAFMGIIIFIPIALFSWFPFFSTFQTRLVFNQAFSRGLEISLILAGNRANTST